MNEFNTVGDFVDWFENKYGIDLAILFEALKSGFETRQARYTGLGFDIDFERKCIHNESIYGEDRFYFKDYGKTWALTKEELL